MPDFRQMILMTEQDPNVNSLIQMIQLGSQVESNDALLSLVKRAQQSGDPEHWNTLAIGFHYVDQNDKAIEVLASLVESFPEKSQYRINIATFYSQTEQIELCRLHLRYVAEHGATEELRTIGSEQLKGYEKFVGLTEEDQRLKDLQLQALQDAINKTDCRIEDFAALARLLIDPAMRC